MNGLGLALRNLSRHRGRSAFALAAIIFGVVAAVLAGGFVEWVFYAMRESAIQSRLGHIQVARAGYFRQGAADPHAYLMEADLPLWSRLAEMPEVTTVAPRLEFGGLVSTGETTVSFVGQGVEPQRETELSRYLVMVSGQPLSAEDPDGVILGQGLADSLGVLPGDPLMFLANTASGGMNAAQGQVRGVFYTSTKAFDDTTLRMPLPMAQTLLAVSGAHSWTVLLDATEATDRVVGQLRPAFRGYEFAPWHERSDFFNKTVRLFSRQMNMVNLIIGLIIVLSISNSLIMGVLERTREIGTLLAMGVRRGRILRLHISEGIGLGVLGGAAGLMIGYVLAAVISAVGIPMPPPPGMEEGFTGEIRVTWALAGSAFLLAVMTTALASLYPAWKASRLEIVDALRHGR